MNKQERIEKRIERKYRLGLLTSPISLGPIVCGILVTIVALPFGAPLVACGGVIAAAIGSAVFGLRVISKSNEALLAQAQNEVEKEDKEERDRYLNDLSNRLDRDEDPRTDVALKDLRSLFDSFQNDRSWKQGINLMTVSEIQSKVQGIFDQCLKALEYSLELYHDWSNCGSRDVKNSIRSRREKVVRGVQESVKTLTKTYEGLQAFESQEDQGSQLTQLGKELNEQLDIARRVSDRMGSIDVRNGLKEIQ
jgi:hypothetical protein